MESKPHIRPKVRSKANKQVTKPVQTSPDDDDIDALLEATRGRLDNLLTAATKPVEPVVTTDGREESPRQKKHVTENAAAKPTGILKKPKYTSSAPQPEAASAATTTKPKAKVVSESSEPLMMDIDSSSVGEKKEPSQPAVKRLVVERDPSQVKPQVLPIRDHRAVEGYTPKMEEGDEDIVISSLADLMDKAGMLPDQQDPNGAKVVEANLEFSVMSKQEFEEEQDQQEEEQQDDDPTEQPQEVFQGRFDIFSDDEDDDESIAFSRPDPEDDDYYTDEDGDDAVELPPPEKRAFMKLWEALSTWITPEAVALVQKWENGDSLEMSPDWEPIVDTSEIAASRCAGLMAMINMNLQRGLKDLEQPSYVDLIAKHRLADLLRTFNYSRSTTKLDIKQWRAMTCVLLHMVLVLKANDEAKDPPASAQAVGIRPEEYQYLTQASFKSLAAGM